MTRACFVVWAALVVLSVASGALAGTTCSCTAASNPTTNTTTYTALCTATLAWSDSEPYHDYKCECGTWTNGTKNIAVCSDTPSPAVATHVYNTTTAAQAYCAGINAEDMGSAVNLIWQNNCLVKSSQGWPYTCSGDDADKGVTITPTKTYTDANNCVRTNVRALCNACTTFIDPDANLWRVNNYESVCRCETLDDPDLPYVRIDAGCVTSDAGVNQQGYTCNCGPVRSACVAANAGLNETLTRVFVQRDATVGCDNDDVPAMSYFATDYTCMDSDGVPACDDGVAGTNRTSGFTTNVHRTQTATTCESTTRRDVCTYTTKCEDAPGVPCVFENSNVGGWTAFGACDSLCGGGMQKRTRAVRYDNYFGGDECPPGKVEYQRCNTAACSVECDTSAEWGAWGECTGECDLATRQPLGYRFRSKAVIDTTVGSGASCPATLTEFERCLPTQCKRSGHKYDADRNTVFAIVISFAGVASSAVIALVLAKV